MKLKAVSLVGSALVALGCATSANALTFNLINTGGVEEGTDAWIGFNAAAWYWSSVFKDDITVNLRVGFTSVGFDPNVLGQTSSSAGNKSAADWRVAMAGDATTALDGSVVANLSNFSNSSIRLNTTVQKALGLYTGDANAIDGTITFNSARPFDFDTRDGFSGIPASDFLSVAIHEIGHALGFTSAVTQNSNANSRPTNTDAFRYKSGQWDMSWGGNPYFSIDGGATEFLGNAGFSAGPDGFQTSHWREGARIHDGVSCTVLLEPQVGILDPTGGLCQEGIVTAQDLALFDALGWDLAFDILKNQTYAMSTSQILQAYLDAQNPAVPEPATWAMMIGGFALVGASLRKRRTSVRFA